MGYRCALLLCALLVLSCNRSELAGGEGQPPGVDKTGGDETDDTGHKGDSIPSGRAIVQQVGILFDLDIDLSDVQLPQGAEQVQVHVVDAAGRELPEAVLMWHAPRDEQAAWLKDVGTRVVAELGRGQRSARFEDVFLRVDIPEGAILVVSAVVAGKAQAVRQHPLRSETGDYRMKVIYAEPGIRGAPVIEFNFDPGVPAKHKGKWYVAEREGRSNVSGHGIVATSFTHLPVPSMKLIANPRYDFDEDERCYVALVNIDDNVKADHFGACGTM